MKNWLKNKIQPYIRTQVQSVLEERKLELAWELLQTKASEDHVIVRMAEGLKIKLRFNSHLSKLIFCEDFEEAEMLFLKKALKPGDVFFDIGSNIGLFSLIAAKAVGETGKVYAFEPSQPAYDTLQENILMNSFGGIINSYNIGISDTIGTLRLLQSIDGYEACNSFGKPAVEGRFAEHFVQVQPLDDFIGLHPDFIKIDVEGWEKNVLLGGSKMLSSDTAPALLVEFTETNLKNADTSSREVHDILSGYGYNAFELTEHGDFRDHKRQDSYPYTNLMFTKDQKIK